MNCEPFALELLGLYVRGASIEELAALTGLVPEVVEDRLMRAVEWAESREDKLAVLRPSEEPPQRFSISWTLVFDQ